MRNAAGYRLGDFDLIEALGTGGMATVWLARHRIMGFEAAVKLVTAELTDEAFMRAFEFEARNHAGLVHPAIAALHEFGHVGPRDVPPENLGVGTPYLVMERARSTLREKFGALDWETLSDVLLDVLDGLAFAHAHGVIHRDIKPENVLVFDAGVKHRLTDFGIAQPLQVEHAVPTDAVGQTAGTPYYMPPEQLYGRSWQVGPWTDLYALGVMTFELLTGRRPFDGANLLAIAYKQIHEPCPALNPRFAIPVGLEDWVRRLLEKSPEARFRRAADARHALSLLESPGASTPILTKGVDPTTADTIVDHFATGETLEETGNFTRVRHSSSLEPAPVAPFAQNWTRTHDWNEDHDYLGPGLFALRPPAEIGFDRVRDVLWRALERTHDQGAPVTVVLSGGQTAPTGGLAAWLATRSHELGAASPLRTFYTPTGGAQDGLAGLITHAFQLFATLPHDLAGAIESQLGETDELTRAQSEILANAVRRAQNLEVSGASARSSLEVFEAFTTFLKRLALERPLIIWLDEVHHAQDGLAFVDHLVGCDLPVLIVMTVDPAHMGANAGARSALDILRRHTEVLRLEVSDYPRDVQSEMLDSLLSLDPQTRDRVIETTNPDVVFMRALVAKLIDDRLLEFEKDSFRLDETTRIPEDPLSLYRARLAEIRRGFGEDGIFAISAAATLGIAPSLEDWEAVLRRLDREVPQKLVSALVRRGLVRESPMGIHFVAPRAHQAAIDLAKHEGIWESMNGVCADHLMEREAPAGSSLLRLARHQWRARDTGEALASMADAISRCVQTQPIRAEALLTERADWLRASGLDQDSMEWIDQFYFDATVDISMGRLDEASQKLHKVIERSTALGDELSAARATMNLGNICLRRGELLEADRLLESSLAVFQSLGEHAKCGGVHLLLGYLAYNEGNAARSLAEYRNAESAYERAGEVERHIQSKVYVAYALVMADRLDDAESVALEAVRLARGRREYTLLADCFGALAEIERFRGNLEEAQRLNSETAYWQRLTGREAAVVTQFNTTLVKLAMHNWQDALQNFDELLTVVSLGQQAQLNALVEAGAAVANLGLGRMTLFQRHLRNALELQGDSPDRDFAWLLNIGVEIAAERDHEIAERLKTIVEKQYDALDITP